MPEKYQWHVLEFLIKKHGFTHGAELGVRMGSTSRYLLENCPDLHLIGVDLMQVNLDADVSKGQEKYDKWNWDQNEQRVLKIEKEWPDRFEMWRMDTTDASNLVEDGSLDFIFIDADHSYEGVCTDIKHWAPKVREGGVIVGHDINLDTVRLAVTEKVENWDTLGEEWNNCWWSWEKPRV